MLRLRRMPLAQLRLRALLKPSQSKPYGFASSPKGESFIKVKIMSETKLSHFDASGSAVMVDVSEKPVTARQAVEDKVEGLTIGADDYVTVGYNPLELLARVKSQLRRYTQLVNLCESIDSIYRVDGLEINDRNRTVTVEGREVKMTPIEYKILRLLVQERGKVLSISQIYESIWHMQAIGADNTIAVHIRHIREKIESNPKEPRYLKVVWGTGYKVG